MDEPVEERDFQKCQPNREHFVNWLYRLHRTSSSRMHISR
jgi:hypothetical protein